MANSPQPIQDGQSKDQADDGDGQSQVGQDIKGDLVAPADLKIGRQRGQNEKMSDASDA